MIIMGEQADNLPETVREIRRILAPIRRKILRDEAAREAMLIAEDLGLVYIRALSLEDLVTLGQVRGHVRHRCR